MSRFARVLATLAFVVALIGVGATVAQAHEDRTVGPYHLDVGFLSEPAYAGQPNGLFLEVTDTRNEKPVEGLEKTLKAEVRFGGLAPLPLTVAPVFGQPGAYTGPFIPTKPGTYLFHLTGTIGTQKIDETFESGPNRFDDVSGAGALQYPDKVPSGSDLANSLAELRSTTDQLRLILAVVAVAIILAVAVPLALRRRRA
ncbi:MAG: hypothetical protein NVSMB8_08300 [Candidatus Limnocylindrales bacterium]